MIIQEKDCQKQSKTKTKKDKLIHSIQVLDMIFHIPTKYKLEKLLGRGSYGVVCSGVNSETGQRVAIKKILKLFKDKVETKRLIREIKLLKFFNHENIIKIYDVLNPIKFKNLDELYIVTELMESDLSQIIQSDQVISEDHIQYFLFQILGILRHIHSAGIVHRDLKPNNILVNSDCEIKLCDFGLARGGFNHEFFQQSNKMMAQIVYNSKGKNQPIVLTDYVTMRYYRAPELLLVNDYYSQAIDIWSVGCILAELLNRKPLFAAQQPHMQLSLIIQHLGKPNINQMKHVKSVAAREAILDISDDVKGIQWNKMFPNASNGAIDILSQMLKFDPDERITAEQALKHPYMQEYQEFIEEDYPIIENKLNIDFDYNCDSDEQLQIELFQELQNFHQQIYSSTKLVEQYDQAYHRAKVQKKISSSIFVTEYEQKQFEESFNQGFKNNVQTASNNFDKFM